MRVVRWKNAATGVESLTITATGIYFPVGKEDGAFVARYVMAADDQTASIEDVRSPAGDRVGNLSVSVSGTTEVIARNRRSLAYGIAVTAISGTLTATLDDLVVRTNWPDNLGRFTAKEDADAYTYGGTGLDGCSSIIAGVPSVYRGPGVGWVNLAMDGDLSARAPGRMDNASRGYAVGSVWRYGKDLYVCKEANTNSALWAPSRYPRVLPGDVAAGAVVMIGGTLKCVSGYNGYAITVSITIATVQTPFDIPFASNGELDSSIIGDAVAQSDVGSLVLVTKIYDQSGSGNHLTVQSGVLPPILDWSAQQGRYIIASHIPPGGGEFYQALGNSATSFVGNGMTIMSIGEMPNMGELGNVIASVGNWNGGAGAYSSFASLYDGALYDSRNPSGGHIRGTSFLSAEATPHIAIMRCSTNRRDWWVNERTSSITDIGAVPATAYTGCWTSTNTVPSMATTGGMRGCVWAFFNRALTDSEINTIRRGAYTCSGIIPQRRNKVVVIGDSRGAGARSMASRTLAITIAERLGNSSPIVYSWSRGSQKQSDLRSLFYPSIPGIIESGHLVSVVSLAAVNDFLVGALTPQQALSETKLNSSLAKSYGAKFIHFSELATTNTKNGASTKVPEYRQLVLSDKSFADVVIDTSGDTYIMSPSNVIAYPDGLHPSEAVFCSLGDMVGAAMRYLGLA